MDEYRDCTVKNYLLDHSRYPILPVMKQSAIGLLTGIFLFVSGCDTGNRVYLESNLAITWTVESNFRDNHRAWTEWIIHNRGGQDLGSDGWTIYFNFLRDFDPETLPAELSIEHINGDF